MQRNFRKNRLLLVLSGVLVIGLWVSSRLIPSPTLPAASWGLSFQKEGQTPVGNASAATLRQYDAAFFDPNGEKTLYLTFDAGFENGCTPQILDVLQAHKVPAAFFLVGTYIEKHPELVRRMAQEGHIVGNHTQNHPDMSKIEDKTAFLAELTAVEAQYEAVTGQPLPKFYRPPQGVYSENNLRLAQEAGYKTVFWSLAYVDWLTDRQPTREEAFRKLLPRLHDGAVILLHSTSKTNAAILDEFLCRCKDLGYTFAPISQIFPLT